MRVYLMGIALLVGTSRICFAQQETVISEPAIGAINAVPAGGQIYGFHRLYSISGAKLEAETKAGDWLLEERFPVGTEVVPVKTSKAFKACVPRENTFDPVGPCFIDDDGDGTFDRHAADEISIFRRIKKPVPYSATTISVIRSDSLKRVVLYQGADASSLRFSYREFKDDLARPAFTEELSVPREHLPTKIRVKNLILEVLAVDGMGLKYRIEKVE